MLSSDPAGMNGNLRAEMARRGIRQTDLAEVLGMSQASLSNRLAGKAEWKLSELQVIAQHMGIPLTRLLEDEAVSA